MQQIERDCFSVAKRRSIYIYDVSISGFTRSSIYIYIYIYDISSLRVKTRDVKTCVPYIAPSFDFIIETNSYLYETRVEIKA